MVVTTKANRDGSNTGPAPLAAFMTCLLGEGRDMHTLTHACTQARAGWPWPGRQEAPRRSRRTCAGAQRPQRPLQGAWWQRKVPIEVLEKGEVWLYEEEQHVVGRVWRRGQATLPRVSVAHKSNASIS